MARRNRKPAAIAADSAPETIQDSAPVQEVEEIMEQLDTTVPPESEKPVKQVGMSNLAQTIRAHRHRYSPALHPVSGKKTANNGDWVAAILLNVPLKELELFVYGHFGKEYRTRGLNEGHIRMCCGNLVRGGWKKDDEQVHEWLNARAPKEEEAA